MKIKWSAEQFIAKVAGLTENTLDSVAEMIKDDAKISMLEPKSGKPPSTKHPGMSTRRQRVTASAPGEAPAVQTGRLYGSIEILKDKPQSRIIVATDRKAHLLELGTRKIAPRPFLRPSLWKNMARLATMLKGKI
jgi:hypothetical protein